MKNIKTSINIQGVYDNLYDERITLWREIGGKYKFQNILKVINGKSFKKVLDFGAGEGSVLKFFDKSILFEELYALELSDSGIDQIKKRQIKKLKEVKKFDGYNTGYSDNEFDLVYCSHVIEHVEHPRLVLREIKRISKYQVFEIPLDYSKNVDSKVNHFLGYGHINIFTPSLFKFLLKSEGFTIENEIHTNTAKEVLEFIWYQNLRLKKTIRRRIWLYLASNKSKIARIVFGNKISNEFYHSAYTCLTTETGDLKIF
jgi:ubiquinone/menaquinone biosynthesis C-methylase UbiE